MMTSRAITRSRNILWFANKRKINQNLSPLKVGLAGDPFFSSDKNLACQLTEVTEIFSFVVFSSAGEV